MFTYIWKSFRKYPKHPKTALLDVSLQQSKNTFSTNKTATAITKTNKKHFSTERMAVHLQSEKIQTGPVPESAARLFWFMKMNIRADDREFGLY